jgi:hypothetical protein
VEVEGDEVEVEATMDEVEVVEVVVEEEGFAVARYTPAAAIIITITTITATITVEIAILFFRTGLKLNKEDDRDEGILIERHESFELMPFLEELDWIWLCIFKLLRVRENYNRRIIILARVPQTHL